MSQAHHRSGKIMSISEGLRQMSKIVDYLYNRSDSEPFREPVPWRVLHLYDYPERIKRPIDLGTIRRQLEVGDYQTPAQVAADVRRVWTNCRIYNEDGSNLFNLSMTLEKKFEEKYRKLPERLRNANLPGGSVRKELPPTSEEKKCFAANLYRIKMDDLTSVISKLSSRCPEALEKAEGSDEMEIILDKIDSRTFHELSRKISKLVPTVEVKGNINGGCSKKRSSSQRDMNESTQPKKKKKSM